MLGQHPKLDMGRLFPSPSQHTYVIILKSIPREFIQLQKIRETWPAYARYILVYLQIMGSWNMEFSMYLIRQRVATQVELYVRGDIRTYRRY
jgi:hypothetical protein